MTPASKKTTKPAANGDAHSSSAIPNGHDSMGRRAPAGNPGRSPSEAIPPTLLRLPDLDPVETGPMESESVDDKTAKMDSPPWDAQALRAVESYRAAVAQPKHSQRVTSPAEIAGSGHGTDEHDPNGSDSASQSLGRFEYLGTSMTSPQVSENAVVELASRNKTVLPEDDAVSSRLDRLVGVFASRKTLLVLLALIAALAIFMPRGENTTSEHETPMLVENIAPPKTTLETPIASMPPEMIPPMPQRSSLAAVDPRYSNPDHAGDDAFTRDPQFPIATNSNMTPPSQFASMTGPVPVKSMRSNPPSLDDIQIPLSTTDAADPETRMFPTVDAIRGYSESFGRDARKAVTQTFEKTTDSKTTDGKDTDGKTTDGKTLGAGKAAAAIADPGPRLVNSRTPQAITDWTRFLPSPDGNSPDLSPAVPGRSGQTRSDSRASQGQSTSIRSSVAPIAPSFEFALPGGQPNQGAPTGNVGAPNPAVPNRGVSAPEARVAMPPNSSLR